LKILKKKLKKFNFFVKHSLKVSSKKFQKNSLRDFGSKLYNVKYDTNVIVDGRMLPAIAPNNLRQMQETKLI
jgi:hypothetical protein